MAGRGTMERRSETKRRRPTGNLLLTLATVLCACSAPRPLSTATAAQPAEDTRSPDPMPAAPPPNERAEPARCRSEPGASPARPDEALENGVGVRGITGSLTTYDVEHAMERRQDALLGCVQRRPRSLGHVAGTIVFQMEIDGGGNVERVEVSESDLGYPPLEDCLAGVVAATRFPAPNGATCAAAGWHMAVEPLRRAAQSIEPVELEPVLERNAEATYEQCEIDRSRRFLVTGYVGRRKDLRPFSVRAPRDSKERLTDVERECLSSALGHWRGWPRARPVAKVSFELHWLAAPKPEKRRVRRAKARSGN